MNQAEHYAEAERLCEAYKQATLDVEAMPTTTPHQAEDKHFARASAAALLVKAQVHATLATAPIGREFIVHPITEGH